MAWALLLAGSTVHGADPVSAAIRYPALTVSNDAGQAVALFSRAAYRAEFWYLQRMVHQIDLQQAGVKTDGWSNNIAEAEWPWMTCAYFGYACVNLAKTDREFREPALTEARWLLQAMQTPRLSGFVTDHFGPPFGTNIIQPAVFVHGHWLQLAVRYREVSGDDRYDATIHRVAKALSGGINRSDQGILRSYRTMWWISDNLPSFSALSRYDALFKSNLSAARSEFISSLRAHYLDSETGLLATYVDVDSSSILQGPRGISTMYGLHFLKDVDAPLARQQYELAKRHLLRTVLGVTGVREFPEGVPDRADIDSGPLIFGLGPSASGFAIAASAVMGDDETAWELSRCAVVVGLPVARQDELEYTLMPVVGQAVILFGKTLLLKTR